MLILLANLARVCETTAILCAKQRIA